LPIPILAAHMSHLQHSKEVAVRFFCGALVGDAGGGSLQLISKSLEVFGL